jgi:hypothetical protein
VLERQIAGRRKPFVAYALECDPRTNDDWFEVKRRTFGGDDGVEFIDAVQLETMIAATSQSETSRHHL